MNKNNIYKILLSAIFGLSWVFAQDFSSSVNVAGGTEGTNYDLIFGFSPSATDGYDDNIDFYAPPPPPSGFDAALMWGGDRFYTQILFGDGVLSQHVYDITFTYDIDNTVYLSWSSVGLSNLGSFVIQDAFGGFFVNVDLGNPSTGTVNPMFGSLNIDDPSNPIITLTNTNLTTVKFFVTPNNYSLPAPEFTVSDTVGGAGSEFNFTDFSAQGTASISGWAWDFGDGDSSNVQNPVHIYDSVAVYSVGLTVTDANGLSREIVKEDLISVVPSPPIADAGVEQSVNENTEVTLDGSGSSDPDGEIVSYEWTGDGSINIINSTEAEASFFAPEVDANTTYIFTLTVTDDSDSTSSANVSVTILNVLVPPTAVAGDDSAMDELTELQLDGSGSNDSGNLNGSIVSYLWTGDAIVSFNDNSIVSPTITALEVSSDTDVTVTLTVTDNDGQQSSDEVIVTVNNVLVLPVADAGDDNAIDESLRCL